jgi:transposase
MSDNQSLAKVLTEEEFNQFFLPFLPKKIAGRRSKISYFATYTYIAKVLRTGMQWAELQDCIAKNRDGKAEIHYTSVFKCFAKWTAFGVFKKSHAAILAAAHQAQQLDLSIINGDGTNCVAKKGAMLVATRGINIKLAQNA